MPTPVKYFSPAIREAYRKVEGMSVSRLLSYLPQDLMPGYESLLRPEGEDEHIIGIIKAADKLSALIKCIEEGKAGNSEFKSAAVAQETYLRGLKMPEVDCFMNEFLPAFSLSLDEQE
jgi:5'-deoxynucleotidase